MTELAVDQSTEPKLSHEEQLSLENTRLHRALRAMYTRNITWMKRRTVRGDSSCRVGLYDLKAEKGPALILIYRSGVSDPLLRVGSAREWAEGILRNPIDSDGDTVLQELATEVLRFLGERGL